MRFIAVLFFLFFSFAVIAQKQVQYTMTKEELIAKQKELQNDINETQRELDAIKNDKKATMGQLRALQNKLAQRQNLIATINDEVDDIDNDIRSSAKEVGSLKQKLELLKIRYAQSIRYAYETRSSYDMLAFLFSSNDFNDAMRRMKYLKTFRDFRKQQVEQIRTTQAQLQHKIGTLNAAKAQKEELVSTQEQQKKVLVTETSQANDAIKELKGKESDLLKQIEKNKKIAARVNNAINEVIQREIAKAAKLAEEERKKAAAADAKLPANNRPSKTETNAGEETTGTTRSLSRSRTAKQDDQPLLSTPTEVALSANFESNKGRLYWPVDKGYISDHFGPHPHPVEPQVIIDNKGVDIRTAPNATIKAVFDGTVTTVSYMDNNQMVMILHGNYFTVYNNLSSVSVKIGQHVSTNQSIGSVGNDEEGAPTIKFQIWKVVGKKSVCLNPEQWLGKAR